MNRRHLLLYGAAVGTLPLFWRIAEGQVPLPHLRPPHTPLDGSKLKPGQFLWQPELAPDGPVVIIVSLPDQLVHVYRNGIEIGLSTCSSGKTGHETPTGVFVVLQKDKDHYSSTYDNAPMPNMQRLTWSGIALHAGKLPGYPASHGCVRLPKEFSKLIFEITHLGIPVIIADAKSDPDAIVHPGLLLPAAAEEIAAAAVAAEKRKPQESKNIASALLSGADRKVIVLIDGQHTWESPVTIADPDKPLGDHVYSLIGPSADGKSFEWMAHTLSGDHAVDSATDAVLSRITVEKAEEAHEMLTDTHGHPTLVVTDKPMDPVTRSAAGFVILDGEGDA